AISVAQELMRTLAQGGPNSAELERARTSLISEANKQLAQPQGIADLWLDAETYNVPTDTIRELSRITAADVQRVANRLFKDGPAASVAVGDLQSLKTTFGSNAEVFLTTPDTKNVSDPLLLPKKP